MAKRARLDVLGDLDDYDEPMMPGSDGQFSDLEGEEIDDEPLTSPTQQANSSHSPLPADWSSSLQLFTIHDFMAFVGSTVPIPETACEVFSLIFTSSFLDTIIEQINLYAEQMMGEEKYVTWQTVTPEELRAYIGFCILMGIAHLPALLEYRPHSSILQYRRQDNQRSLPGFFSLFVDITTNKEHQHLGKVRRFSGSQISMSLTRKQRP